MLFAAATSHIMGSDNFLANSILSGASGANLISSATEIALLVSLSVFSLQKWLFWIVFGKEEADIHYTKKEKAATPKKGSKTAFFRTKQCGLFNARLRSHCVKERLGRIDFATLSRFLQHSKINGNGLAIQCANIDAYSDSEAKSSHDIQMRK